MSQLLYFSIRIECIWNSLFTITNQDNTVIDYYGKLFPLNQCAVISEFLKTALAEMANDLV